MQDVPIPDKIEMWPIDRLIPYSRNARTHSDDQIAKIAASIVEFGWNQPILVDEKHGIIAGHGRLFAAKTLLMDEVPVIVLTHMTEAQKRGYIIADNKLSDLAGWDHEILSLEMQDLAAMDFDLELTGFSDAELATLLGDEVPAPQQEGDGTGKETNYKVVVQCVSELEQARLVKKLTDDGYECKPVTS